jgi:gliding motility-associated transport system permease protein
MRVFLYLWRREMASYFRTSIAYVVGVFFLAITGFSFWMLTTRLAQGGTDASMSSTLFGSAWFWLDMLIVTPLLTMRLFAEERRMGTLETLMTAPVTETHVVLAKFFGAYTAFLVLWVPTLAYASILNLCGAQLPPVDWGPVAASYLGTALVGAAFLSVGLLCSILTRHQIISAMGCLAALGILLSGGLLPFTSHTEEIRQLSRYFSAPLHMLDFAAGSIDTRAIVWYLSATVLLLFISIRLLEARRLR